MDKPNGKKPQFKVKAIETRYDGYRFRSRLEARWAMFFNTLRIPYIYEMEGFVLEGTPYLPDFYLPKLDCFIEIKGVEPTDEEIRRARLLSLYSMKRVYLFAGEVGKDKYGRSAYSFTPPRLGVQSESSLISRDLDAPPEVLWAIQRLEDAGFYLKLNERKDDISIGREEIWGIVDGSDYTWDDLFSHLTEQGRSLIAAMDLLQKHRLKIVDALKPEQSGDEWIWSTLGESAYYAWGECTNCSALIIAMEDEYYNYHCGCHTEVNYDAPRILNAYKAAREARF